MADHVAHDRTAAEAGEVTTPVYDHAREPLVIVPCGAKKKLFPSPASELYLGTYHALCMKAARAMTSEENIRILSGLHGLLELGTVVVPYEMRLGDVGSVDGATVVAQATEQGLLNCPDVVVLAGRKYSAVVTAVWPHAKTPLHGCGGIGEQQHRLARIAADSSAQREWVSTPYTHTLCVS